MWYFSPVHLAFNHGFNIWPGAVEVTDEEHDRIQNELSKGYEIILNPLGHPDTIPPDVPQPLPSLGEVVGEVIGRLNADYEQTVAVLKSTYPLSEAITWPVQVQEAKLVQAWLMVNPTLDISEIPPDLTPFLNTLSAGRDAVGIEGGLQGLAERVLENDALFSPAMAYITAQRHGYEKEIFVLHDTDDRDGLNSFTWSFTIPQLTIE